VHASPDNFPSRKHSLVQAMLAVNDMFYLAVPMVTSLFYEDVPVDSKRPRRIRRGQLPTGNPQSLNV
jgi:hypothetical protein